MILSDALLLSDYISRTSSDEVYYIHTDGDLELFREGITEEEMDAMDWEPLSIAGTYGTVTKGIIIR